MQDRSQDANALMMDAEIQRLRRELAEKDAAIAVLMTELAKAREALNGIIGWAHKVGYVPGIGSAPGTDDAPA